MTAASGKFVLRLPSSLHAALKREAKELGCSLNEHCVSILAARGQSGTEAHCADIVRGVEEAFGDEVEGILLFGSQARGDAHEGSDVDILVIMDARIPITRALYRRIPGRFSDDISIHFAHMNRDPAEASSLLLECALDGKILLDRGGAVRKSLDALREYILSGRIKRGITHGQGFWVRQ